ncbi:GNAT family N-acetyltransferase [Segnochrobactrum spirostomi]|uniref:GNAT family N-acetyltransferase n=1 Tax=Segnochrobactrum spirostomi TaxID=2608987 RepID=A0A6A7Y668_9HYPH|nr:GNAT family N-acetyltransferase [Segnochrobactrum spirostomi]MQT13581.1 GNAT family N-acetyltransferase [Segnochrobactrum spirostomi]
MDRPPQPAAPIDPAPTEAAFVARLEDATINAFPSTHLTLDRRWLSRLTPGHDAKRINSFCVLDAGDDADLEARLERIVADCARLGAVPTLRRTPLTPPALDALLDRLGWSRFDETAVMRADLMMPHVAIEAPTHALEILRATGAERGAWADILVELGGEHAENRDLLAAILARIVPEAVLAVAQVDGAPVAAALVVRDGDLVGLFEVVTHAEVRGQGFGAALIAGILGFGRATGARHAWLQVKAVNPAVRLYRRLGFVEAYPYFYRRPGAA